MRFHLEKDGEELPLTPIEFNILWYLCERRGKVVSPEELFEAVWSEKYLDPDNNNTVIAPIARLRDKRRKAMREDIKAVEIIRRTADQLAKMETHRNQEHDR